jgi:hypothetical protein
MAIYVLCDRQQGGLCPEESAACAKLIGGVVQALEYKDQ